MNFYSLSDQIMFKTLKNISFGVIYLTNFDNRKYILGSTDHKLKANIKINKPGFSFNIISKGSIGLAESYMRGDFETDNLSNLIEITARNIKKVHKISGIIDITFLNQIKKFFIKNTKKRSKVNISKHYDLGNEFFSLWLDNTLTYSSAIFEKDNTNLESAQINKYKKLANLLNIRNGDKVLEIGCGWGGFAEFVGKNLCLLAQEILN